MLPAGGSERRGCVRTDSDSRRDGAPESRTAHKTTRAIVNKPTTANTIPTANDPSAKTFPRLRRRRLRRRCRVRNITFRRQRRSLTPTNTPPLNPRSNEQRAVAQSRDTSSFLRRLTCPGGMPVFTGEALLRTTSAARARIRLQPVLATSERFTPSPDGGLGARACSWARMTTRRARSVKRSKMARSPCSLTKSDRFKDASHAACRIVEPVHLGPYRRGRQVGCETAIANG